MNKLEVDAYFELLESILTVDDGVLKPSCIFNMDETGLQLNNRPGHVLAEKGSKAVSTVTSTEKGETITVIACCNAEGTFLPPACIMKGKNKNLILRMGCHRDQNFSCPQNQRTLPQIYLLNG
ncbi:unnamed protein product [Parnassius mnemosyne]|uniref:DDE-1 domain-containing protein n=1 Tax=Parnassius mnemosyne TaxID=213953 RepID=A0AAV1LWC0_9NEOP